MRRRGFTLVEMMVATALTLFIMTILSSAFISGLETFSKLKAIGDMEHKLRTVSTTILEDLKQRHFEGTRRLSDIDINVAATLPQQGFFSIRQGSAPAGGAVPYANEGIDLDTLPSRRATNHSLNFTIRLKGNRRENYFQAPTPPALRTLPTTGPPVFAPLLTPIGQPMFDAVAYDDTGLFSSQWAEVGYELVPSGQTTPGGTPLHALYRTQFLLPTSLGGRAITVAGPPPFVVTAPSHGLTNGRIVTIRDVNGIPGANGTFPVTVLDANTFRLNGSSGTGGTGTGGWWMHAFASNSSNLSATGNLCGVDDLDSPATRKLQFSTPLDVANPSAKRLLFIGRTPAGNKANAGQFRFIYSDGITALPPTAPVSFNAAPATIRGVLNGLLSAVPGALPGPVKCTGQNLPDGPVVIDLTDKLANPTGSLLVANVGIGPRNMSPPVTPCGVWLTYASRASFHPSNLPYLGVFTPTPAGNLTPRGGSLLASDVVSFQVQAIKVRTLAPVGALPPVTIAGSTIIVNYPNHGLPLGVASATVTIKDVLGIPAANGTFTVNVPTVGSFNFAVTPPPSGVYLGGGTWTSTFEDLNPPLTGFPAAAPAFPAHFDTSGALPYRIQALQVTIRVWDRKTQQTRQVTVVQDM